MKIFDIVKKNRLEKRINDFVSSHSLLQGLEYEKQQMERNILFCQCLIEKGIDSKDKQQSSAQSLIKVSRDIKQVKSRLINFKEEFNLGKLSQLITSCALLNIDPCKLKEVTDLLKKEIYVN